MRKTLQLLLIVGTLVASSASSWAQVSATASATASARVIAPIRLQKLTPLNFGSLVRPASGTGTATMSPTAVAPTLPTTTGGVYALLQGSNSDFHFYGPGPATFQASGENGFAVTVTLPDAVLMIIRSGGTETLNVDHFTTSLAGNGGTLTLAHPGDTRGVLNFTVGATVSVPAGSLSGWYDGDFNVSVNYN